MLKKYFEKRKEQKAMNAEIERVMAEHRAMVDQKKVKTDCAGAANTAVSGI